MYNDASNPTLTHVTFIRNFVDGILRGSGIYNDADSSPTLNDVTFIDNPGSALVNNVNDHVQLTNVTISYNLTNPVGYGIALRGGSTATLTNVTINQSTAIYGDSSATATLRNTLLVGGCEGSPTIKNEGGNLAYLPGCGSVPSNMGLSLKTLADNGGATPTHALPPGSVAIGAGVDANCPSSDQRGQPRFGTCDIGAYEYNQQPFVTTRPASPVNATGATLRAFVNANTFSTTATFQYGLTDSYGLTAAASPASLSGSGDTPVSAGLSGLAPGATYHFRIVATNAYGTDYGDDQVFTTTATYVDPEGDCAGHTPCYSSLQAAMDAAPLNGEVRAYGNTYPESVTLNRAITVTCVEDLITLNSLSLSSGTFVAPSGTLTLNGDLSHSGGAFNANGGTLIFNGSNVTRTLTASVPTQFNHLKVNPSVTLVLSTNNDNVGVSGTLTNAGVVRKSFGLSGVSLDFVTLGDLSALTVERVDQNHPQATGALQTGKYWSFTPNAGAAGFNVNLTLPTSFVPDAQDKVCRYTGSGQVWDCAVTRFDAALQTIMREGVTAFSDWSAGNNPGPTSITLRQFSSRSSGELAGIGWVGLLGLLIVSGVVLGRARRKNSSEM